MVAAIAGAMKLLSETAGTWKVLELRIAKATAAAQQAQKDSAPVVPLRRVNGTGTNGMNGNGASHG
jgi:hypothetical protein